MNEVVVCTFTEGDMNFVGRVFKDEESAHQIFTKENGNYFVEYGADSVKEMILFGYVTFETVKIEGCYGG